MRATKWFGLASAMVVSAACGNGEAAFADIGWQLECPSTSCTPFMERIIKAHDGEDGHQVQCRAEDRGNDTRALYLVANKVTNKTFDYGIEIANAVVAKGGGPIILASDAGRATCTTIVRDDARYTGGCGSQPPQALQPCQVADITISGSTITGNLQCLDLPGNNGGRADVAGIGTEAQAFFRFEHCAGLD